MVVESWAVTTVLMTLGPTARLIEPLKLPELTTTPLTLTEAVVSAKVGLTVIEVVALETLAVYPVVAPLKVGESAPVPKARPVRSAFALNVTKVMSELVVVPKEFMAITR